MPRQLPGLAARAVRVAAVGLLALAAAACTRVVDGTPTGLWSVSGDARLIADYFDRGNAAAQDGAVAQKQFLEQTQHPDVDSGCDLGGLTVRLEPTLSTLRPADGWRPSAAADPPRGRVYVVAVLVTVQRDGLTLGVQVGSMHVVVLDGTAYGFAPCPA